MACVLALYLVRVKIRVEIRVRVRVKVRTRVRARVGVSVVALYIGPCPPKATSAPDGASLPPCCAPGVPPGATRYCAPSLGSRLSVWPCRGVGGTPLSRGMSHLVRVSV